MIPFFQGLEELARQCSSRLKTARDRSHSEDLFPNASAIQEELSQLETTLVQINVRVRHAFNTAEDSGTPDSELDQECLTNIHKTLERLLRAIDVAIANPELRKPPQRTTYMKQIAIETQKLRALFNLLSPVGSYVSPRIHVITKYIEFELRRVGRETQRPSPVGAEGIDDPYMKWAEIANSPYLEVFGECWSPSISAISLENTMDILTDKLYMARHENCSPIDRWIHIVTASFCLRRARSQILAEVARGELSSRLGWTVKGYLTELEIDLFEVLLNLPTQYLAADQLKEYMHIRIPNRLLPSLLTCQTENVFTCITYAPGEKIILLCLQKAEDGSLFLNLSPWTADLAETLYARDLRPARIFPYYPMDPYNMIPCDITIDTLKAQLHFSTAKDMHRFQWYLTGHKVMKDYGTGILIRSRDRFIFKNKQHFVGRLQLWYPRQETSGDNTLMWHTAANLSSNTIHSVGSSVTDRTRNGFPLTPIISNNGQDIFITVQPQPPLLVLFPDQPQEKVIAFILPRGSRVDPKNCDCKDPTKECPRCFISRPERVELEIGRDFALSNRTKLDWIEIKFSNGRDTGSDARASFVKDVGLMQRGYAEELNCWNTSLRKIQQGYKNM